MMYKLIICIICSLYFSALALLFADVLTCFLRNSDGIPYYIWYLTIFCNFLFTLAAVGKKGVFKVSLGILILATLCITFFSPLFKQFQYHSRRFKCSRNFYTIKSAIDQYAAANNGNLPDSSRWCDVLIAEVSELSRGDFLCPFSDANGNYSLNESIIGLNYLELPEDTVVFFEIEEGWNKAGDYGAAANNPQHNSVLLMLRNGELRLRDSPEVLPKNQ